MVKRIFLAANLPNKVKSELMEYQTRWPELPARWTKPENLHVTLVFLGNTSDQELEAVQKIAQEVGSRHKPFSFSFQKIIYGPNARQPRMIWVTGKPSAKLLSLQKDLEQSLANSSDLSFAPEHRSFSLHLTLARLKEWEFRQMDLQERAEINEELNLEVSASSFEIMESQLRRSGAEYTVIESIQLGSA